MSWAAFSTRGKLQLAFPSTRMNSEEYQEVLEACLIPFLEEHDEIPHIFQHDNASIHASASTKQWLADRDINILSWPACSPDLNVLENAWGMLARRVYANNRQFQTVAHLKMAVIEAWNELDMNYINRLVESVPDRLFQLIQRNGSSIDYYGRIVMTR
uniref:Tc1-like transposase DDE domain-containing protein n=1 Tax=Meloidogyne javanica TaxID=6303 RepID=A0A915MVI3_MELJA